MYEKDDEWLLVKVDGGDELGYVPANYVQEEEGSGGDGFIADVEVEVSCRSALPFPERVRAELTASPSLAPYLVGGRLTRCNSVHGPFGSSRCWSRQGKGGRDPDLGRFGSSLISFPHS